jgi:dGTPase
MTSPDPAPIDWAEFEAAWLAPYAMPAHLTRGRVHLEPPHPYRGVYQRDRERIVHAAAFRRLMGKTQVLVAQINDHHRTRLTHTLEVAQISRTIARRLRLNEDLTEAIALAHDLGHPPFGHAGEAALDECLGPLGGFDHNLHALRRVDVLEQRYPEFPGLNLSWEVREAMALHSARRDRPEVQPFLPAPSPLLEVQVVDAADSLAYDTHDLDDALGSGLIDFDDLRDVEFWQRAAERSRRQYPGLTGLPFRTEVVRELIAWQVTDLLEQTEQGLRNRNVRTLADVRSAAEPLVGFGPAVRQLKAALETFLRRRVYLHPRVQRMAHKGQRVLHALYGELCRAPEQLPERHARRRGGEATERVVGDYLAGMTDRFAQQEYLRLFHPFSDL